jgi:release factor glutamine methyltransferase
MKDTCLHILNKAVEQFRSAGVDRPRTNAELLLEAVIDARKIDLYLDRERVLTPEQIERFNRYIQERMAGKPLQYIIGSTEFFGLEFKVNQNVLIPRPETETLVEIVIDNMKDVLQPKITDLGTGSGAIAIALAKNLKGCYIFATDISPEALQVAKDNAKKHQVDERIDFLCGDLFEPLRNKNLEGMIDCVVSNPPYVSPSQFANLPREVKDYEPIVALKTEEEGTLFHRKIIENSLGFLRQQGILALEVGLGQAHQVADLIRDRIEYEKIEIKKDLGGIERVVKARKAKG